MDVKKGDKIRVIKRPDKAREFDGCIGVVDYVGWYQNEDTWRYVEAWISKDGKPDLIVLYPDQFEVVKPDV